MSAVLASWNVHGWVGRDGRPEPARSFEVIRAFEADVIALQEVQGSDWPELADAMGYRGIVVPGAEGAHCNALLVRGAVERVRVIDLSVPGREPRAALDAAVEAGGAALRVVATHLGLRASERRHQAERLAAELGERDTRLPLVLLGDLNDWTPRGRQLRPLARRVGPLSRLRTFPSRRPLFPLDRAAWHAPDLLARLLVVGSKHARFASDHLPLRLELSSR